MEVLRAKLPGDRQGRAAAGSGWGSKAAKSQGALGEARLGSCSQVAGGVARGIMVCVCGGGGIARGKPERGLFPAL